MRWISLGVIYGYGSREYGCELQTSALRYSPRLLIPEGIWARIWLRCSIPLLWKEALILRLAAISMCLFDGKLLYLHPGTSGVFLFLPIFTRQILFSCAFLCIVFVRFLHNLYEYHIGYMQTVGQNNVTHGLCEVRYDF